MRQTRRILLCLALAAWTGAPGAGRAASYYVATSGSDTASVTGGAASGAAPEQAFRTIARGVEALRPGDTLVVGPGVYHEQVFIEKSGTPDAPITVRAAEPGRTELVGSVRLKDWSAVGGRRCVYKARLDRPTALVFEKDTDTEYVEKPNLDMVEETPGSFHYDPEARLLYVHPSDDLGMDHHIVDACVLDYGLASRPTSGARTTTDDRAKHTPRRVGLVIEGFVARDYNAYGIYIRNADYCAVRACIVHHCRRGIFTYNSVRSRIADCEAFACADRYNREQGNIGMMGYVFEGVLENNVVHRTRQHGIRFYGGFYGCVMRNNLAYGCDIGVHIKGQLYTRDEAERLARFSDDGKPNLKPGIPMIFEGNVACQVTGQSGLVPGPSVYRRNTGEMSSKGYAVEAHSNIEFDTAQADQPRFADPAWRDLRLQSDSPWLKAGRGGETSGAFPYRGEVFFVAPGGKDANAGTSVAAAWKTPGRAVSSLKAGQTLYLLPGAYAEPLVLRDLKGDAPTVLRAHGKGPVFLDGGIRVRDCRSVTIQGFRIRNTVLIENSAAVRLEENEIFDSPGDGVRVSGACADVRAHPVRVVGNTIVKNAGAGVGLGREVSGAWIVNNIIRDNAVNAAVPPGLPASVWLDYNNIGGAPHGPRDADFAPGFVNAAAKDFRLTLTSLCRGRGWLDRPIGAGRLEPAAGERISFEAVCVLRAGATSADLAWRVRGGLATLLVAYGTDPDKLDTVIVRDTGHWYQRRHLTTLRNLTPNTRYYFRVGNRRLLDGPAPYHAYRYAWPERTPKGEEEYYRTLRREDVMEDRLHSFTTRTGETIVPRAIYVSVKGRDDASGSETHPLRTLGRACEMAGPGDRVVVRAGTYRETARPWRSGLPGQPITFEAAAGERVEINGAREQVAFGFDLRDRHHIVVRGFVFFGQTETAENDGGFGHVCIAGASDILVERCLFDGRMNYINAVLVYRSENVTLHNNIFVSHHASLIAHDNAGPVIVTRNSFLGPTLAKIYGPRNARLVIRNNLFDEHLFPKKKEQYKLKLPLVRELDMDYNCYYFDPKNDERRIVDYCPADMDPAGITALPEEAADKRRVWIKGSLAEWQRTHGQDRHSLIADPKWQNPGMIEKVRSRPAGWPDRFFEYAPINRADLRLAPDSPCRRAGENGQTIGADHDY